MITVMNNIERIFLNADTRILHTDSRRYLRPLALDLRKSALTNIIKK